MKSPSIRVHDGLLESEDWGFCTTCRENGIEVVLNTSLNRPGEPIVETPEQAKLFSAPRISTSSTLRGTG